MKSGCSELLKDTTLIIGIVRQGDAQQIKSLYLCIYNNFYDDCFKWAHALLGYSKNTITRDAIKDQFNDTFMTVMGKIISGAYEDTGAASFKTYFRACFKYHIFNLFRKSGWSRVQSFDETFMLQLEAMGLKQEAVDEGLLQQADELARKLILSMNEPCKSLLHLKYVAGMKTKEIRAHKNIATEEEYRRMRHQLSDCWLKLVAMIRRILKK